MEDFLKYIIQVNLALLVFGVIYRYLLSSDTFLSFRRWTILSTLLFSFIYPFLPSLGNLNLVPTYDFNHKALYTGMIQEVENINLTTAPAPSLITLDNIIVGVWSIGSLILLTKLIIGVISIFKIRVHSKRVKYGNTNVRVVKGEILPFSFFNWIFIPSSHNEKSDIVLHEKAHVDGCHSFDVILCELLVIIFWFNPAVWLIRRSVRENLEFLADRNVIDCGHNRKEYQYLLLNISYQAPINGIVNYFNMSQLKKRIMMMNKARPSKIAALKYALIIPALFCLILTNSAQTKHTDNTKLKPSEAPPFILKAKEKSPATFVDIIKTSKRKVDLNKALIFIDDKKSSYEEALKINYNDISLVTVLNNRQSKALYGEEGKGGAVVITLKEKTNRHLKITNSYSKKKEGDTTSISKKISILDKTFNQDGSLFIVDGFQQTEKQVAQLDANRVKSITVLKNETARQIYGEKGKNGVVIIETGKGVATDSKEINEVVVTGYLQQDGEKMGKDSLVQGLFKEKDVRNHNFIKGISSKTLYVLDGIEITREKFNKINVGEIENITVLGNESGKAIYGERGANGVVVIETKSNTKITEK